VRGFAEREHDVVRQLRQQQDVGDVCVERLVEQARCLTRCDEHHRRSRVLSNRGELVRGQ
jgi:hypothetical protein